MVKSSFAPVADERTRVLILGSLPGEVSLAQSRYYAHPQNQFWRLMQAVLDTELVDAGYEARLARLLSAGVGLWDVIKQAERVGSLDGAIRNHQPNALIALTASLPNLNAIAFNGGAAWRIGVKLFGDESKLALIALPSSSPAYTAAFESKLLAWLHLRQFLQPKP